MKTYRIETDRLIIRCYEPKDARLLKKSIDESLDHLRTWMPWALDEPEAIEKKIVRLRKYRGEFDLEIDYNFGIFSKDDKVHIGSTGLHTRAGEGAREIGYWLNAGYLGKGYATETVKSLAKVAFKIEGIARLEIRCDPNNIKSRAIPEKLGFVHTTTLKDERTDSYGKKIDSTVWSLWKEEYDSGEMNPLYIQAFNVINEPIAFAR